MLPGFPLFDAKSQFKAKFAPGTRLTTRKSAGQMGKDPQHLLNRADAAGMSADFEAALKDPAVRGDLEMKAAWRSPLSHQGRFRLTSSTASTLSIPKHQIHRFYVAELVRELTLKISRETIMDFIKDYGETYACDQ